MTLWWVSQVVVVLCRVPPTKQQQQQQQQPSTGGRRLHREHYVVEDDYPADEDMEAVEVEDDLEDGREPQGRKRKRRILFTKSQTYELEDASDNNATCRHLNGNTWPPSST
ncbi:hypothetical protein Pcinc_042256 [Petrolisthes cinctipes]|uniref:Secreted protein n=1 Tax=Petrolisthes cinctipes TaxID=88211 RepID=A0AAE1EJ12_PETCI|nr:hypothetical protein Pcinc_042256 [Petrolisthes cinctipes]